MKECIYASNKINYIKRRHRAYLWMFRAIPSVDIDDKTGTVTIMWCKYAFGHVFVMGEEVRKFEDDESFVGHNFNHLNLVPGNRYVGKQYAAFLQCVKQIEAGQNTVFVGLKWMMISTEYYKKLADRLQNKTGDVTYKPTAGNVLKAIKLEQFKKFATDNDILWFYNKPHWRTTQYDFDAKYNKKQLDEIRKYYRDDDIETDGMNYMMRGNYIDAVFGTPEEREKERRILQNKKREETMKSNIGIARVCYEANRQYCIDNDLLVYSKWDEAPEDIKDSVIRSVAQVIINPKVTATQMHEKWMDYKASEGWIFGKLDIKKKLHPNMVTFNKLSKAERGKDMLFIRTVKKEMKK